MPKKKINKKNKELLRALRALNIAFVSISFAWLLFFVMLAMNGSWDDINVLALLGAPVFALLALVVAGIRIYRHEVQNTVAIAPLAALGCSALFFCYVAVNESLMMMSNI
ncbi:MAG: hypothetical protein Q4D22_02810 [Candidatus Saccharibacteria bacterium]|jgi:hypothetical protein|nr:hypothetical protein [Candidatus Saccharibacteria bacterium]